jgi:hypothetical protein
LLYCWRFSGAAPMVITAAGGVCGWGNWLAGVNGKTNMGGGYGYDHAPSMLTERDGHIFFGTRNGVIYAMGGTKRRRVRLGQLARVCYW